MFRDDSNGQKHWNTCFDFVVLFFLYHLYPASYYNLLYTQVQYASNSKKFKLPKSSLLTEPRRSDCRSGRGSQLEQRIQRVLSAVLRFTDFGGEILGRSEIGYIYIFEYNHLFVSNIGFIYIEDFNVAPQWNQLDGLIDRRSHISGGYSVDRRLLGVPVNPIGRTGLRGRGLLGRWGPNHAADPIITRWKRTSAGQVVAHEVSLK